MIPMPPFLVRSSDNTEQISPYTLYFILCEGAKTDYFYFDGLLSKQVTIDMPKTVKLLPNARFIDKIGADENNSDPKNLIDATLDPVFRKEHGIRDKDKFVVVFDLDIFTAHREATNRKNYSYQDLLDVTDGGIGAKNIYFAVTNPCFELFLLLHKENAWESIIKPDGSNVYQNDKVSNQRRYVTKLFVDAFGFNSKSNDDVKSIVTNLHTAIEEEKNLNQEISCGHQKITSNVGAVIQMMINEAKSQRIY